MMPIIQNVVATVNLGITLELEKIARQAKNTEYNPKRLPALIMRIRDPKATALIFKNGKMVITGTRSEDDAQFAAKKFMKIVHKTGFSAVKFQEFKIQNIVGTTDVRFPIRLEKLALEASTLGHYEPEAFPGLVYRMVSPKVVLLIFVSGKIVLTGAKQREDLARAYKHILPVLKHCRKE